MVGVGGSAVFFAFCAVFAISRYFKCCKVIYHQSHKISKPQSLPTHTKNVWCKNSVVCGVWFCPLSALALRGLLQDKLCGLWLYRERLQ